MKLTKEHFFTEERLMKAIRLKSSGRTVAKLAGLAGSSVRYFLQSG
jgi:hypothetical protein